MAYILTRYSNNGPLQNDHVDSNFINLNRYKVECTEVVPSNGEGVRATSTPTPSTVALRDSGGGLQCTTLSAFAGLNISGVSKFSNHIYFSKTSSNSATMGLEYNYTNGELALTGNSTPLLIRRNNNIGDLITFNYAGTSVGTISTNGTTTTYGTTSDHRLKTNVKPMTGGLATVSYMNPVTFDWVHDGSPSQGFIAHELQALIPDAVTGQKDQVDAEGNPVYQNVDTSFVVATLTSAIKELKEIVESQQQQINELKAQLNAG